MLIDFFYQLKQGLHPGQHQEFLTCSMRWTRGLSGNRGFLLSCPHLPGSSATKNTPTALIRCSATISRAWNRSGNLLASAEFHDWLRKNSERFLSEDDKRQPKR